MGADKQFTVVMRGPSAAVFMEQKGLRMSVATPRGPATVSYLSRWISRSSTVRMPGQLWIEIQGPGEALATALPTLANAGFAALPFLSVACNAAIEDPQVEVAFETTQGIAAREYLQIYIRPESSEVAQARPVPCDAAAKLCDAITSNADADRLRRAADHYRLAMSFWSVGKESLILAHLWMAIEALTPVQKRLLLELHSVDARQELAHVLGVDIKELDSTIRKRFLLENDDDCYNKAKRASDGFEHSFLGFDQVRKHAMEVRERLARYVRDAILSLSNVDSSVAQTLKASPYDKPLGTWPFVKFMTATLRGTAEQLAKPDNAYPICLWKSSVKSCDIGPNGTMNIQFHESITAELADGITFSPTTMQIWEGGSGIQLLRLPNRNTQNVSVEVTRKVEPQEASGIVPTVDDPATTRWRTPVAALVLNSNAIRHMALYWLQTLTNVPMYKVRRSKLWMLVLRIRLALLMRRIDQKTRVACIATWSDALSTIGIAKVICAGATNPDGLVLFDSRKHGSAPVVTNVAKVDELNNALIEIAKKLAALLKVVEQSIS